MGRRPFVRFYHLDWSADTDVDNMSMEEVGTYFTLLVRQMVEGYVTADHARLRKRLNVDSVEDVQRLLTPAVLAKFVPCPEDPTKLYNKRLAEVIQESDAAVTKGLSNAGRRWGTGSVTPPSLESSIEPEPARPAFNFQPILADYPPRKNRAGESAGLKYMQDFITEPESYERLWAAVRAYRKERSGEDKQYTMQLDNFMKKWDSYVPANFRPSGGQPRPEVTPSAEGEAPSTKKRAEREKPPWTPRRYDTPVEAKRLQEAWTPERRQAWEEGRETN